MNRSIKRNHRQNPGGPRGQVVIPPQNIRPVICPNCKNDLFQQGFKFGYVSRILSPNGQDILLPQSVHYCTECKYILNPTDIFGSAEGGEDDQKSVQTNPSSN